MRGLNGIPLPPPDEPIAFLIGAGCSSNLPPARKVVEALLEGITENVLEADSQLRSVLAKDVRFEFIFQTIRDVLDLELSCLAEIYGESNIMSSAKILPTKYHRVLARVLNETNHTVVTTNFDLMLEDAYSHQRPAPVLPLRVLSSDEREWEDPLAGHTLMKVHGSTDDVGSLCATFDTVSSSRLSKHNAFTQVLRGKSLCVVGNGAWYDDVLQVLLDTNASDRFLYWFTYKKASGNKWHRFKDIDEESAIFDRPGSVLKRLVEKRARLANRVFLIEGDTEKQFIEFLKLLGLNTDVRASGPVFHRRQYGNPAALLEEQVPGIVRRWLTRAEDDSGFRRRLVCIDLAYIHSVGGSVDLSGLASQVRTQFAEDPVRQALGWPRVAKAAYDAAEEDSELADVIAHSDRGIAACQQLISDRRDPDPAYIAALLESYGWKAEAQRTMDDNRAALRTCEEARRSLPALFRNGRGLRRKVIVRSLGALLNSEGETRLAMGQLAKARRTYSRAATHYRDGGDLIWLLYARLGHADATRLSGRLTKADKLYRDLEWDIHLTGSISYLTDWLLLHRIDTWRVKVAHGLMQDQWGERQDRVQRLIQTITDPAALERAMAAALELRWMGIEQQELASVQAEYAKIEQDYKELAAENSDNYIGAELALSYAEFAKLRTHTDMDEAVRQAGVALERALEGDLPLLEIWARVELLDLDRLQGKKADWESKWKGMADRYHNMGYPIALAYVFLIAQSGGESVSPPDHLLKFLRRNGFHAAADQLVSRRRPPLAERGIRLAFPGLFTLY